MTVVNMLEKVTGTRPTDDHLLSSLLSQFEVERPRPDCSIPGWDLALVLHALHAAPFEPLAQAPLWALTSRLCSSSPWLRPNVVPNCTLSLTEFSTRRTGLALCSYRTRSSWLRLREPATPIPAYRKLRLKPLLHLLAPTLAPMPTTVWSVLSRFSCNTPRPSAAAGNAFSSPISRATTTRLRHLQSRRGWSRQFAMSMNIRRTRLHVSTTSRATIFMLLPLAGTPYRKSPPETSCALHNGGLTTLSQRSTSSTSL